MEICKSYKEMELVSFTNKNGLTVSFFKNGTLSAITYKNLMLNLFQGNPIDGSISDIYLRLYRGSSVNSIPLTGITSKSRFSFSDTHAEWIGDFEGVNFVCRFFLDTESDIWLWKLSVTNNSNEPVSGDILYIQDIGISDRNGIRNNEAYVSQYIDHCVLSDKNFGYTICSRQNLQQSIDGKKSFPWLQQGALNAVRGYITDGFQFYGMNYKFDNIPAALKSRNLDNIKRQYELAMAGLVTEEFKLKRKSSADFTFYGLFQTNHEDKSCESDLKNIAMVQAFSDSVKVSKTKSPSSCDLSNLFSNAELLKPLPLNISDTKKYFSTNQRHRETIKDKLCSFFYDSKEEKGRHVVLSAKEQSVERPHGHIMMSGTDVDFSSNRLTTTSYIYGLFNSHITLGNTSFNKFLSITRTPLNILKSSGQRVFVKIENQYKLLGIPSAFDIGFNSCSWIYKFSDFIIIVKVWTSAELPVCYLDIIVEGKSKLEFLITNNIVAGVNEYDSSPSIKIDSLNKFVEVVPDKKELISSAFPDATFCIIPRDPKQIADLGTDELIFNKKDSGSYPFVVYKTNPVESFSLAFSGNLEKKLDLSSLSKKVFSKENSLEESITKINSTTSSLTRNFSISLDKYSDEIDKINGLVKWYTHNAMIHFLSPHGLEQYSGAAWGTRDVSQGPVEFFLSTNNSPVVKKIILEMFSHQFEETGTWPQWFMFDNYSKIQQEESHGDIIVWPLKVFCDYLSASGDFSILSEKIPYTKVHGFDFTKEKHSLLDHLKKEIQYIKDNFIKGTSLSCYGDGDWDDTLQPANSELRKKMVSGWTTLLTYQTLLKASEVFLKADLKDLSEELGTIAIKIREDYNKFLIKDGIAGGFAYFRDSRNAELMVHPYDNVTGIKYRLLPMTRGIISELFTKEQADLHIRTIREKLYCPDGVRLMDTPAKYIGGPNKYFKRAEQASNVGREISLQYVHAHIRFIEAMAKYGDAKEVFKAINTINPIGITNFVKNAEPRQSNSYFSSSDPAFNDRYEAQENFAKVRKGEVKVKGGWRIYSSGPGIFINQIISNFLGFRVKSDHIEIDPVIPFELDGLSFSFDYELRKLVFKYSIKKSEFSPYQILINGKDVADIKYLDNPYRKGGAVIPKNIFDKFTLINKTNIIEIKM
ncbi:MAG: cellobiose phosphorylase [Lentisphaerota bacterium]